MIEFGRGATSFPCSDVPGNEDRTRRDKHLCRKGAGFCSVLAYRPFEAARLSRGTNKFPVCDNDVSPRRTDPPRSSGAGASLPPPRRLGIDSFVLVRAQPLPPSLPTTSRIGRKTESTTVPTITPITVIKMGSIMLVKLFTAARTWLS